VGDRPDHPREGGLASLVRSRDHRDPLPGGEEHVIGDGVAVGEGQRRVTGGDQLDRPVCPGDHRPAGRQAHRAQPVRQAEAHLQELQLGVEGEEGGVHEVTVTGGEAVQQLEPVRVQRGDPLGDRGLEVVHPGVLGGAAHVGADRALPEAFEHGLDHGGVVRLLARGRAHLHPVGGEVQPVGDPGDGGARLGGVLRQSGERGGGGDALQVVGEGGEGAGGGVDPIEPLRERRDGAGVGERGVQEGGVPLHGVLEGPCAAEPAAHAPEPGRELPGGVPHLRPLEVPHRLLPVLHRLHGAQRGVEPRVEVELAAPCQQGRRHPVEAEIRRRRGVAARHLAAGRVEEAHGVTVHGLTVAVASTAGSRRRRGPRCRPGGSPRARPGCPRRTPGPRWVRGARGPRARGLPPASRARCPR